MTARQQSSDKNQRDQDCSVVEALEAELQKLKRLTNFGQTLKVVWSPNGSREFSGVVRDGVIYVYETEADKAIEVLKHEFMDFLVCQAIKPYEQIANHYTTLFNSIVANWQDEAYSQKEKVVDALVRMLSV